MYRSFLTATALLIVAVVFPVQAAKVKVWHHHAPAHFDKAHFQHAVVSSEGALRLARQVKPLASLEATHVWAVVEDRDGNLIVGTGDEGTVWKLTADGKIHELYTSEDSQVLCLAAAPDGSVYAGTGPTGTVVRITPDGDAKVLHTCDQAYVWALAVDPRGQHIYAATGPKGRIYQLTPEGKATVFYTTKQNHVLSLALGSDGMLYAGTDRGGLVYRIDAKGKGFVLCSLPQGEVRCLQAMPDGIYAGTSAPTRKRGAAGTVASVGGTGGLRQVAAATTSSPSPAADVRAAPVNTGGTSPSAAVTESSKGTPAPSIPPPGTGENSLYRIAPDGTVRELFREKVQILGLLRQDGRILIGTGLDGQFFEVEEATKERSELARLDHGQVQCLCRRRDGSIVLGAGDPGKLYVLHDKFAAKGTVVSDVHDAKLLSKWGALRWQADVPSGTSVTVAVRTGNVAEPDETWSDWSTEQTDPQQAVIAAPTARFLQYRVTLTTTDSARTPSVRDLTLRYRTTNQAPEVQDIDVPRLDAVTLDNPKKLKFKWTAIDPNEDELTYSLFVRKDGWTEWVQLEDGLEKKEYEWDTTAMPSGIYRLRVAASDRKDNPTEEALSSERVSAPFAVTHVPPTVTAKFAGMEGEQAVFEATATDPLVRLTAASFAVNGKKWINVFPTDGLFDSKQETFRFKTEVLKPATYVVVLRVRDAAGNVGSGDVVFTVPAAKR